MPLSDKTLNFNIITAASYNKDTEILYGAFTEYFDLDIGGYVLLPTHHNLKIVMTDCSPRFEWKLFSSSTQAHYNDNPVTKWQPLTSYAMCSYTLQEIDNSFEGEYYYHDRMGALQKQFLNTPISVSVPFISLYFLFLYFLFL